MLDTRQLAINGGEPIRTKPWLDNFTAGEEEIAAAVETIRSGYLSLFEGSHTPDKPFSFWGGPKVQKLEQQWCEFYGSEFAVSMNSATSGLYAAVGALGLGYGDEVIVSPYTMSACAVCCLAYGAIPIFADVSLETGSLSPDSIESLITERTAAIIVVHQFGIPADMDRIMDIASSHGLKVIEDCAQAHGARYRGAYVGTIGDIGVFSLNVNKTIQTGEGAVCTTNDEDLRYRLALIRNHGEAVVDAAGYDKITNIIGFNYRLSEIAAAMASEQLKKLDALNAKRLSYVEYLSNELDKHDFLIPPPLCAHGNGGDGCHSTYYVYPTRFLPDVAGVKRERFVEAINAEGLRFYQGYTKPLYTQSVYQRKLAFKHGYPFSAPENQQAQTNYYEGACPNAEELYYHQMLLNEHVRPPHDHTDMEDIAAAVDKVSRSISKI